MPTARTSVLFTATAVIFVLSTMVPSPARPGAATIPAGFADESMASALAQPVGIAEVPDPSSMLARRVLFVEQRTARVALITGGSVFTVGFVPGVASAESERGLLGIAVDADWPARPFVYVHCTDGRVGHRVAISRFTLTGDLDHVGNGLLQFDAASRYDVITDLPDDASNHNGGTVRFGPDRMLYVSLGDDAKGCPAIDITQSVGKILRLDVSRLPAGAGGPASTAMLTAAGNPFATDADSSARLVWTFGLRNPFRFQVDPLTGTLVIGDVGQGQWEELDLATSGGMNMGWPLREGPVGYDTCALTPPGGLTGPIYSYSHATGVAVVAGPLYRRPVSGSLRFPSEYEGDCFVLDYYTGIMRRLDGSGSTWALESAPGQPTTADWAVGMGKVSDILELADGSLWYCRQAVGGAGTGEIRRISFVTVADVHAGPSASTLRLSPPRPSPSRGPVALAWSQPAAERVNVALFDLTGRRVRTLLVQTAMAAGEHELQWDGLDDGGRRVLAGLYFVRVQAGDAAAQSRITRIR